MSKEQEQEQEHNDNSGLFSAFSLNVDQLPSSSLFWQARQVPD